LIRAVANERGGRDQATVYEIDADLIYSVAESNGWRDNRTKPVAPAGFRQQNPRKRPRETPKATTQNPAEASPQSVEGEKVDGDYVGITASVTDLNEHEPTLAAQHPQNPEESLGAYVVRLSGIYEDLERERQQAARGSA
jgi:hypothetical protein